MSRPINPWKDFASYKSSDARYFKGREESIAKFLRIVDAGTMSVLYATSGIGKTSFVHAGIVPVMIERGYAPIHILFTDDDFSEGVDLSMILKLHVEDEIKKHNENEDRIKEEKKRQKEDYTTNKWRWNSLLDIQSEDIEQVIKGLDERSLWWKFHACEIKTESGQYLKPILLLDQFEEVFVKAKAKNIALQTFFDEIEELASSNLPSEVETVLNQLANQDIFLDLDTHHHYKIIFSLRKEYLSDFDYWTNDRHSISELQQNRMLLLPLSRTKAMKVIKEQPLNLEGSECYTTLNNIAEEILNVIDDKQCNEIEPFILSVLCYRLYDRAVGLGKNELKSEDLNTYSASTIIREFYEQKMQSIIPKHSHIIRIEEELVDEDGKRGRVKVKRLKDIEFEKRYKKDLEDAHLIRLDNYNGEDYIELVHDRVADTIMERRKETTKKSRLIFARIASLVAIIGLFFLTYWLQTFSTSNPKTAVFFPYMDYQEGMDSSSTRGGIHHNNPSIDYVSAGFVEVINCPQLKDIEINSVIASILIRNCRNLKNILLPDGLKEVSFLLDECPQLNPIHIPASVRSITFKSVPPNDLYFTTENDGRYIWKDRILWDTENDSIIYARYDAKPGVSPPVGSKKENYVYQPQLYRSIISDTISLYRESYSNKINSPRFCRNDVELNLSGLECSDTYSWDLSRFPNLQTVILPKSLELISSNTFRNLKQLRYVILPHGLIEIGNNAFEGCTSLREISFPITIKQIGPAAFYGCSSLQSLELPDSIKIYHNSFDRCLNLKDVTLPKHFEVSLFFPYGMLAFKECPKVHFHYDSSILNYSVDEDGTIIYKNDTMGFPLLLINSVKEHTYNSEVFAFNDSINKIRYLSKNGELYAELDGTERRIDNNFGEFNYTLMVSDSDEFVRIPITHKTITLVGSLNSCKELHFPYSNPFPKTQENLLSDIADELKQNIVLYVPHGALNNFKHNDKFDASEWNGIEEEGLFSWIGTIILYHLETGLDVVGQWGWFWPVTIIVVLLIAALITIVYLYRRKETNRTSGEDVIKFILNFTLTLVVGVLTWYTFYWFIFLTSFHYFGPTFLSDVIVDALVSVCLAILFVYIVLYSKGFNLKGFMIAVKYNWRVFGDGIKDLYFKIRHLSWKSINLSLQVAIKRVVATTRDFVRSFLSGANRFRNNTIGLLRKIMQGFVAEPVRVKASICLSLLAIIAITIAFFVNGRENSEKFNDKLRKEIVEECNKIIEADTIEDKQIVALHDKLVESISIQGMRTLYYSDKVDVRALGDSIFIVTESDSCHYYNFSIMRYGNVNFGNPIQKTMLSKFDLSDSKKFVYCNYSDSVYIWPTNSLEEKPFEEEISFLNSGYIWFAQDKYVCFENSKGNYVIYNTKDWTCSTVVEKRNSTLKTEKIPQGLLVTKYTENDKKSEAYIYDENLKLRCFTFEGEYKGCLDKKYLVSRNEDMYMLYNIKNGLLLDKKCSNIKYEFPSEYSYAYKYNSSDSIYIFNAIDNQIVFDILPYKKVEINKKYVCYKNCDSIMIYHMPTNQIYNLGYSEDYSCRDSLVAINVNDSIIVYNIADSIKILGRIPYSSSYIYMRNSNNYLTFNHTKVLFQYNADSLWKANDLTDDVYLRGWYCNNNNDYYSMENYDDGSWLVNSEIKSDILRGGWCFIGYETGCKIYNIKSIKSLIKESQIDDKIKEKLYSLIDKHYAKKQ